jgi:hypothetical protein
VPKQGKSSKRQDTAEQSNRRDTAWARGKERKKARNEAQIAAHKANQASGTSPWAEACKKRSERPDQVKRRREGAIKALAETEDRR